MLRWFTDFLVPFIAAIGVYVAFDGIQLMQESIEDEIFLDIDEASSHIIFASFPCFDEIECP